MTGSVTTHDELLSAIAIIIAGQEKDFTAFMRQIETRDYSRALRVLCTIKAIATENIDNKQAETIAADNNTICLLIKKLYELKASAEISLSSNAKPEATKLSAIQHATKNNNWLLVSYLKMMEGDANALEMMREYAAEIEMEYEHRLKVAEAALAAKKVQEEEKRQEQILANNLKRGFQASSSDITPVASLSEIRQQLKSSYNSAFFSSLLTHFNFLLPNDLLVQNIFLFGVAMYSEKGIPLTKACLTLLLAASYTLSQEENQTEYGTFFGNMFAVFSCLSIYRAVDFFYPSFNQKVSDLAESLWVKLSDKVKSPGLDIKSENTLPRKPTTFN